MISDLVKRADRQESFDLSGDLVPLPEQRQELLGHFRQHDPGRTGPHNHDRLRVRAANTASMRRTAAHGALFFNLALTSRRPDIHTRGGG